MHRMGMSSSLITEEKSTLKWFLTLFYSIFIVYDVYNYFIYQKFILQKQVVLPSKFEYIVYFVMFCLIPIAIYISKQEKQHLVKYIVVITYIFLTFCDDIIYFFNNSAEYQSGNVVEMFVILFSPIFVNKTFFKVVTFGITGKYLVIGIILQTTSALFPVLLTVLLSIISLIFLNRFQSYVSAVKLSYDKQLEGMVKGVIATLELKDNYTRGHSERVANYALSLAKEIKRFSQDELKSFNYACLLHDIGKVNIPDHILMKPSKLTNEEFDVIKTHPVVGAEAVKNVEGLKDNICVIRSHHERWDGKGYPDQLAGENIPLQARIAAIADAFDAMTSSRSYRNALPIEEAYSRIIEGQGTQFDPELVKLFKKVYPTWIDIHRKYGSCN
ncbi:HD-GYP domain-containing protein [Ferdinandcohnia quinoae]|uniref:HD-GYP domain-containing protein n=1 Tax=Fredinandcohnia quinoae TaxID=2918902 RepID=A0AAW5DY73_9BACI|nr:HD-GYP domain-containing protein [Fredinandcohnia sp. SECRCQ15]MCH1624269.1 HD-GYP domain-containing protein [Fredinandcohnia sp. SECRCQ15]